MADNKEAMTTDYVRIARAIAYLSERVTDQPQLDEVASHVGLSPFHFQRVFRRRVAATPGQYQARAAHREP